METNLIAHMARLSSPARRSDRGASAVEFALVAPVLILVILGIIEMSLLFNRQISVTSAAREAAREMAVTGSTSLAQTRAIAAAPSLNPDLTATQVAVSVWTTGASRAQITPALCARNRNAEVTVTYPTSLLFFNFGGGSTINLTGKGVMRCGG